jgi:hypothetical protein
MGVNHRRRHRTSAARAGGIANYFREEQMPRLAQQHKAGREMFDVLAAITDKDGNFLHPAIFSRVRLRLPDDVTSWLWFGRVSDIIQRFDKCKISTPWGELEKRLSHEAMHFDHLDRFTSEWTKIHHQQTAKTGKKAQRSTSPNDTQSRVSGGKQQFVFSVLKPSHSMTISPVSVWLPGLCR